jgi:hypothetical protein
MDVLKTYQVKSVKVLKHQVDMEDPAKQSAMRIAEYMKKPGQFYINPEYTLIAGPQTTYEELCEVAQQKLVAWNQRLSRILGSSARKKLIKKANELDRRLKFTGVLVLDGVIRERRSW